MKFYVLSEMIHIKYLTLLGMQEVINVIYYYYHSLLHHHNVSVEEALFLFSFGLVLFGS